MNETLRSAGEIINKGRKKTEEVDNASNEVK